MAIKKSFARNTRRRYNKLPDRQRRLGLESLENRIVLTSHLETSGVYDENVNQPNAVDRTAQGSTIDVAQFTADVADAYAADHGGVLTGRSVGSRVFWGTYGQSNSKTMYVDIIGTNIGIGSLPNGPANATAISSTDAYSSTSGGTGYNFMEFDFRTADDG